MPLNRCKKPSSKRKLNGKKINQVSKMKQKHEMEVTLKEQISELDKEILAIQISEAEVKLNRKVHLCAYMEEEISIYKTLYSGKLFLKSESMKLLNRAFQDFASEIFFLDQECESMKSVYSSLAKKQHFCVEYQKRVDMLNTLGAKLEENFLESQKCYVELPMFLNVFAVLEEKASAEREKYTCIKEEILIKFDRCLWRIENEVKLKRDDVINNRKLKVDLLPLSWQALFQSGRFSKSWLDFSLKQGENPQLKKKHEFQNSFGIINGEERQILEERNSSELDKRSDVHQQYLCLEAQNVHQRNKIKSMKYEIGNLEKGIQSLEISGETYFEKSYLLQIVHSAGSMLKQEFEIM